MGLDRQERRRVRAILRKIEPTDLELYECGLCLELSGYPRLGSLMVTAARLPNHESRRDWLCLARAMARKIKLLA